MTIPEVSTLDNALRGVDTREQLFNEGATGPVEHIQVSTERIVQLRGILFDLDPHLYHTSPIVPSVPTVPEVFFDEVASKWLDRHPVLAKAEVRNSGTGLHAILRFGEPVVFKTDGERDRWAGIVQVVQAVLPIDPDQPGITAITRPVGSVNSKNGATVKVLKAGTPVTADEVLTLFDEMCRKPFRTVLAILAGVNLVEPCPNCNKPDTKLSASNYVGHCYGSCGNVGVSQLYDLVLSVRRTAKEAVANDTIAK